MQTELHVQAYCPHVDLVWGHVCRTALFTWSWPLTFMLAKVKVDVLYPGFWSGTVISMLASLLWGGGGGGGGGDKYHFLALFNSVSMLLCWALQCFCLKLPRNGPVVNWTKHFQKFLCHWYFKKSFCIILRSPCAVEQALEHRYCYRSLRGVRFWCQCAQLDGTGLLGTRNEFCSGGRTTRIFFK